MTTGTAHRAVRDAVVAVLEAAPSIADGGIRANRRRPMAQQHAAQVFVFLEDSMPERGGILGAPIDWQTRIRVECVARGVPGVITAEDAADDIAREVFARLQRDITLGGLLMDLVPQGMNWVEDESDTTLAACQLMFQPLHRTNANSIAAQSVANLFALLLESGDRLLLESGDALILE